VPIYSYTCTSCNAMIEKRQSFADAPLTVCDACGGTLRKVIHPVGIVFKGSGWYVTDSRKSTSSSVSDGAESGSKSEASSASSGANGEAKSTPAAGESKSTAASEKTSTPAATSGAPSSSSGGSDKS
jgi:putative FmdB family regulatory protein